MEILCYADHEKGKNWYNDLFFICIIKSKIWKTEISCSIFKYVLKSVLLNIFSAVQDLAGTKNKKPYPDEAQTLCNL